MKKLAVIPASLSLFLLNAYSAFAQGESVELIPKDTAAISQKTFTAQSLVTFIIQILIFAGILIALIFLILGGIQWILSGGDKQKVEAARNHIVAAIIGLVIVVLSVVILSTIGTFLGAGDLKTIHFPSL